MRGDHKARTWVSRLGSGFFPCQSQRKTRGVASCHSAAGCAASSLISRGIYAATASDAVLPRRAIFLRTLIKGARSS